MRRYGVDRHSRIATEGGFEHHRRFSSFFDLGKRFVWFR